MYFRRTNGRLESARCRRCSNSSRSAGPGRRKPCLTGKTLKFFNDHIINQVPSSVIIRILNDFYQKLRIYKNKSGNSEISYGTISACIEVTRKSKSLFPTSECSSRTPASGNASRTTHCSCKRKN
jgi:hypothetical protein